MPEPILVAQNISKQFPGVRALDEVDLEIRPGEVHALVGENGAGKSTLIKILGGLYKPNTGVIVLDGHEVHFSNPRQAQMAGISVITQEFDLVPQLTVAENIYLGREPVLPIGLIDWQQINQRSAKLLSELGMHISSTQRVEFLSIADKQMVEIAKALSRDFRVIIMDEPTAALSAAEAERLFEIIDELRKRNIAILYVSHRMSEIFRIANRVTVLRDGRRVDTRPVQELTEKDVVAMMLGRELEEAERVDVAAGKGQQAAIRVANLNLPGVLDHVAFHLDYGEVLGCAGLIGSGRTELTRILFGLERGWQGEIFVNNQPVRLTSPRDALNLGIFMLTEDRKAEGIFPDLSVLDNILLQNGKTTRGWLGKLFIAHVAEQNKYREIQEYLSIRAHSPFQMIATLSGGNQQKAILGRALISKSKILLLNEPTRGVDVGTKMEIHVLIRQLARDGHAVVVSTSDVPELVKVSDRCLVLSQGKITGILAGGQLTEENILACAVGHARIGVAQ